MQNFSFERVCASLSTARRVAVAAVLTLAMLPVVLLPASRTALAGPPPVFTIFVPFDEASIDQALWTILTLNGYSSANNITSQITVTIAADDTILYWDHWEDGYETDIANAPGGSTTETWGDQDISNGAAPGVTADVDDVLNGGDVVALENDVALPRDPATILFDGRDKVAATRGLVLTRAGWDATLGTVHAGAVAASNLSQFGTRFDIPIGENIASNEAFQYTSVSVQASDENTFVELDIDGDGDIDQTATIDEGETWFVNGGVNAGARVQTSKPSQVHLITGDIDSAVSGRWYEVFPEELLDNEYVAAAQTTTAGNPVSVFVHNNNETSITVAVDAVGTANDTNLNIPQRGTVAYTLPDGSGARFSSSDNFSAVSATVALAGNTTAFDWGYTLVPASSLTSGVIVGWGDGSQVAGRNDSPVWVAPLDATDIDVDFENDGVIDQTITGVQQYESIKIVDANDFDMTGARISSTSGVRLSVAWGQDPDVADTTTAYDLGTAVLPSTSLIVSKSAELATDQNSDGRVNPGDTLRYEVTAADAGSLPLNDVVVVDDLPSTLTYVPGTAAVGGVSIADDATGSTVFPFDESGFNMGGLVPGQDVVATFEAALVDPFPLFTTSVRNTAVVTTAEGDTAQATSIVPVVIPDLYLAKTSDLTGPVMPGQTFTYSLAVANIDTSAQTGVTVTDTLPAEVSWVSTSVTRPVDDTTPGSTKQASDDFSTVSYSNDAADWEGDWTETDGAGAGPAAGDVTIASELGSNRLQLAGDAVAAQRTVDTAGYGRVEVSYDWRRAGFETGDYVRFEVSNTGGTSFIEIDRFEGVADDIAFTPITYDLTNFGGGDLTLRWTTSPGFDGAGERFQIDDLSVDLTRRVDETIAGSAPTTLFSGGELLAGESLTVDVTVTVDPSISASIDSFSNTANANSTQSPASVQSTATVDVARASIGDTVWHDLDGDGVVDAGEPVLAGVTVELENGSGALIASDVTDAGGQYSFGDLDPGDYTVTVVNGVPAGMSPTDDFDGGQDETVDVTVGFGENQDAIDFGYATPVSIGDRVFADIDGDGVENGVDFGIDSIDVTITGTSPNASHPTGSTTTAVGGTYGFTNLLPGTYTVTVDTTPLSTSAFETTTANSQSGSTQTIVVTSGNDDFSGDFGYVLPAAIGDYVWHDLDADGVQDAGEPALAGVTVTATGPGLPVGGVTRTTDANGFYIFANLDAGTFDIVVAPGTGDLPAGWDSSTGGATQSVTVGATQVFGDADFGFYTQASIGDFVFEDVNGNGSFDVGIDAPIDGVDVTITGTSAGASHQAGSTLSTVNGAYDFTGLEPGTYTVTVDASGFPAGTVNTLDGASPSVTVQSTDDVDTADFGYLFPATISDRVWHDLDGDGVDDAGEPGLASVELTLTGGALAPAGITTTTDVNGAYAFSNLPPGTYTVTVSGLPTDYVLSTTNGLTFTVDSADVVDTADFGAYTTADVGDLVWHDLDADGTYDLGEPVFDAVTVTITGGSLAGPVTVDTGAGALASGEYVFADLDPGTYTVAVDIADLPAGYSSTTGGDSRSVVLESATDQLDIDFGYATTATIGDLVYDDLDGDGAFDAGEPGLGGVTITLDDGLTTVTVDTAADGSYDFTGVAPGSYTVSIDTADLPAGAIVTQGAADYSLTVVSADDVNTADFGFTTPAELGDRLWNDTDGDGVQDAAETSGFAGVTVTLTGPGLPPSGVTDITDAAGTYGFAGLAPGTYTVTITATDLPAGVVNTFGGTSQVVVLTSGENDDTVDFGWFIPASIGDLVWHDLDGDGVRDAGEPGIDAVTMTIDNGTATTALDTIAGAYDFTGLAPDTYAVSVDTADLDSGAISTTGGFSQTGIAVVSGDDVNTADFGVRYPASIGDLVYVDLDGDGSFDVGEPGIGDVTITITGTSPGASHAGGTTTTTAATGSVGAYSFGNLTPGTYDIVVDTGDADLPAGAVASTVTTYSVTVESQEDLDTADFGFYQPTSIGDRVFDDANGDGDDESGAEPGLAGVTLELRQGATTITSFTTTSTGAYDFTGLAPGTYDVVVTGVPAGYTNTLGGSSQTVTVSSGDDENDVDFGYYLGASIGDLLFDDLDGDGVFDVGEPGFDGVTVTLSGDASASQDTVNGVYDFTGLQPGTYTVTVDAADLPAGVVNTLGGASQTFTVTSGDDVDVADFGWFVPASIGDLVWDDLDGDGVRDVGEPGIDGVTVSISGGPTDDTVSGGAYSLAGLAPGTYTVTVDIADLPAGSTSTTGGFSQTVTVVSGDAIDTVDFGIAVPASIGDLVWIDADGDGTFDAGEAPIENAVVRIIGPGIAPAGITDTTDAAGAYGFSGLLPGTYTVTVESGLPAGAFSTTGGSTQNVTVDSGQSDDTIDFGYAQPAAIGDRVWADLDGDGTQNDGASGLAGIDVTITGTSPGASHSGGSTTTTGVDGAYLFTGLNPGTYTVSIDASDLPLGESWSSTTGGRSQSVTIASGDTLLTADFGEVASGSIGDLVFDDGNGDGSQVGDSGIAGVEVTLTGPGLPPTGVTDTTDAIGAYAFTGLAPGTYTVTLSGGVPAGAQSTTGGNAQTVVITSGLDVDTADFGLASPGTVGDETFIDSNGDGDRDAGEPGLAGVTIELRDGATVVASLTSTAGGYDFTGVMPGTYDVVVTGGLPAGAVNTLGGSSQSVTVTSGSDTDAIDFGWYVPASIGDLLFDDLDGDGVFDVGEPGFDGVTVTLSGDASASQDTVNGVYDFTGLQPGTYTVTVDAADLPAGVVNTLGGASQTFTVTSGDDVDVADFGWFVPASIGDLVWDDLDGDGVRDVGEPGIDGVTVSISGGPTDDTVSGGAYSLAGLAPGTYTVTVDIADLPAGSTSTTGGFSQTVTLISGQNDLTIDFGVAAPATLGDIVFQDSNGNGAHDTGEVGIAGVDVTITGTSAGASHPTGTTVQTGTDGAWSIGALLPGTYSVVVDGTGLPAGATFSTAGGDTQTWTLTSGLDEDGADFGYVVPSTIGDRVFVDDDADGLFGPGDIGIDDVTVTITGTSPGASHPGGSTLTTSGGGLYDFTGLLPGTYEVTLDAADADFVAAVGASPTSTTGGATLTFTVDSATDENTADFGYYEFASIGDRVWDDLDGDASQNDGATGISGLDVTITGTSIGASHPTGSTIQTGADGAYSFDNLVPGTYTIDVAVPSGAVVTTPGGASRTVTVGSGDAIDTIDVGVTSPASIGDLVFHDVDGDGTFGGSDVGRSGVDVTITGTTPGASHPAGSTIQTAADGSYDFTGLLPGTYTIVIDTADLPAGTQSTTGGFSQTVTVESGDDVNSVDFGDAVPGSIGDRLFDDTDGDGIDDGNATDPGFGGVDVTLTGPGQPPAGTTVQTAADGSYSFAGLMPGTYTVTVDTADLPGGVVNTLGGASQTVTLESADAIDTVDFGWYLPASIGDRVYDDLNGTGTENAGEPGIDGVEVTITGTTPGASHPTGTTATTVGGAYSIAGLAPGTYTIELTSGIPVGMTSTTGGNLQTITIESGDAIDTVDFGLADFVTIGDRVWHDLDADGVQDIGETDGFSGVVLELLDIGGAVIATDTTDGSGAYSFNGVRPGTYSVRVGAGSAPSGYVASTPEAVAVTAISGVDVLTADIGYRTTGSIGDLVWDDLDGDGVRDAGEPGLPGVTVELSGAASATTITDGAGSYSFPGLDPGDYTVTITAPASSAITTVGGASQSVTLASGDSETDTDFGVTFEAAIGDLVWHDLDADGALDAGEPGLGGVLVELRDAGGSIIATDSTDGAGGYAFTGLLPGDYTVTIDVTTLPVGSVSGARFTPTTADSHAITLTSGDSVLTADTGYATTAELTGTVFEDDDASGDLALGEPGLDGITVELVDGATVVATVTTATDGTYTFTGVAPGTYEVRLDRSTVPAGFSPTTAATVTVAPDSDERITGIDFGEVRPSTIGDLVWHDLDGDGTFDIGVEPGLPGIDVELVDSGGGVVATETTGADGSYDFSAVAPGTYTVRVDLATLPTGANSGTGFITSAGRPTTLPFTIESGDDVDTADFAFRTDAVIGDLVWHDLDADGTFDSGVEPGLPGIDVELLDAGGSVIATDTTDGSGAYSFTGVAPGTYTVRLDRATVPAGYSSTTGNDPTTLTVVSDQLRDDVDFGEAQLTGGLIGDQVWDDLDGDGVQDAGEPGIDGIDVELLDAGGSVIATRTTSGGGGYSFNNLAPGDYSIRVVSTTVPAGYAPSTGGLTMSTTLLSGDVDRDLDVGLVADATIGDVVWHDLDADGVQDAGEPGLGGVTVEIRSGATVVATATTDAAGAYSVSVAPGTYDVALDATTIPVGAASGTAMVATAGPAAAITVISNEMVDTADFGLATTARIGDTIFDDLDGDGVQDPGEPGLVGVDIEIRSGATLITTVTTGTDGFYEFPGLAPGTYTVSVDGSTLPTGSVATTTSSPVTLTVDSDERRDDIDLGFALPASLDGVVWEDADGDGIQNDTTMLNGLVVELLDTGGAVVATDTTDSAGAFFFANLLPGDYRVRTVPANGWSVTTPDAGGDDTVDSDLLPATGTTAALTVTSGASVSNVDTGLFQPGSVGDTVFADLDANGVQDVNEPGIAGVTITLRDSDGAVAGTAVTGTDGSYTIPTDPGSYTVVMTVPAGWGVAPGGDSQPAVVVSGGDVTDADFALLGARTLDGVLVYDVAGDSTNDVSDPGLGGVTVTAIWDGPAGPVVFTTTTGPDGSYRFSDLPPGSYSVVIDTNDLPDGIVDPTIDPDGGADLTAIVDLSSGNGTGIEFGVTGTARLGDNVFVDADGDGELDPAELGVGGVTVTAVVTTTAGVMTYTTVTDVTGFYEFTDLPAGDYTVSIDTATLPLGFVPSTGDRSTTLVIGGADDSIDLPLVPVSGPTAVDDNAATPPASPVLIDVVRNDAVPSGTTVTVVSHTTPSNGVVVLMPDGTFTYTPDTGFEGTDTFDYTICDLDALAQYGDTPQMRNVFCSTATVSVETPPPPPGTDSSTDPAPGTTGGAGTPSSGAGTPGTSTDDDGIVRQTTGDVPPSLPRTGSDALPIPLYGALLLAAGAVLLAITRRRRTA